MSISLYLKNQQALTTQLARQIEGNQGPAANFLRTPILGDQKLSQTSTMNSTIAKRLSARTSPAERVIGRKFAALSSRLPQEMRNIGAAVGLPLAVYSTTKGIVDAEQKDKILKGMGQTSILGAGASALATGIHRFAYPTHFKTQPWAIPAAYIAGLALGLPLLYGMAHSGGTLGNKILYKNEK